MAQPGAPTPYPDVSSVPRLLVTEVQARLEDRFVALYVHGSLATGGFAPARSDIDFVVVTAGELPAAMLPCLEAMHVCIRASGLKWATKLEGSYIPLSAIRRYDPTRARHPALRVDGSFAIDYHASDWVIQRHVIREQGLVLAGPHPETLIDPVQPEELRRAAEGVMREWWAPMLHSCARLQSREYQAYAVLTMCRVLYTLAHCAIVPKDVAARWAQEMLGDPWRSTIERALAWPHDPQPDELEPVLALIRHTLDHARCSGNHRTSKD